MPRVERRVPVSERALIQRINRALARKDEKLKTYRGGRSVAQLGRYYIVDLKRNVLLWGDVDLEPLGREEGCLKKWEYLAD